MMIVGIIRMNLKFVLQEPVLLTISAAILAVVFLSHGDVMVIMTAMTKKMNLNHATTQQPAIQTTSGVTTTGAFLVAGSVTMRMIVETIRMN